MANLSRAESRRLYSWWWDSHSYPKNSKWLQEDLADMDAKVKLMIKLIEEDADSFAKRAEMYYKKRPELMKLVEEFYRAYRALAERYDHATGELRQAHRTMADAFPNQILSVPTDDSPMGSSYTEAVPHTPEMPHPLCASVEPDEHKGTLGFPPSHFHAVKRTGAYSNASDSISKKGLKQLNELLGSGEGAEHHVKFAEARVRKGFNFHGEDREGSEIHDGSRYHSNYMVEAKEQVLENRNQKAQIMSKSEGADQVETEVQTLKETLAKLEVEKEVGLLQYQQALERLSSLDTEVSRALDDARRLDERASKADTEVQILNQALAKLQAEKEAGLQQYEQCLEKISSLESKISTAQEDEEGLRDRASKAETEAQNLKEALVRLEAEGEASLLQYNQFSETISDLQMKLCSAEKEARSLNERAIRAETEVQFLREASAKLDQEKRGATLQYQQSLEAISYMENKISHTQEEARRLSNVVVMGFVKLQSTEEQYRLLEGETQCLKSEVNTLLEKVALQEQELVAKSEELRRLERWNQQEFEETMQAISDFDALQEVHFRSQGEQRALVMELRNRTDMMNAMELRYQLLQDRVRRLEGENRRLNETKAKLEEEAGERNALQQEIYCLKEEINDMNKLHLGAIEQLKLVGLEPDFLGSSVKDLHDENSRMKEIVQKENDEKVALFKKWKIMENFTENNVLLENSLTDVTARLEVLRKKVKALEETCQSLEEEKFTLVVDKDVLIPQLETAVENVKLLSEKSTLLENFLPNANAELEVLRAKSKSLEERYRRLDNEKCGLVTERNSMVSQFKVIQQKLEDLEKRYTELEAKYLGSEKENESKDRHVEELQASWDLEKQEHAGFIQSTAAQLAHFEEDVRILQAEAQRRKKVFEEELDKSVRAQLEIFILQRCIRDMEERNLSLLIESQKQFESSMSSEKLVTRLKRENSEQKVKVNSLLNQVERLRWGIRQMFAVKALPDNECHGKLEEDEVLLWQVLGKFEDLGSTLLETQDEKQQLLFEKSVLLILLAQMRLDVVNLVSERNTLCRDLKIGTEMNQKLRLEVGAKDQQQEVLKAEMENQRTELSALQEKYPVLQNENAGLLEKNWSLAKEVSDLKKENCKLEDENYVLLEEVMDLGSLSVVFSRFSAEKAVELKELCEDLHHLCRVNGGLEKALSEMGQKLEMVETENLCHKDSIGKLRNEVNILRSASNQLNHHVERGKDLLNQKEVELSEAKEKLEATESKNWELQRGLQELKSNCDDKLEAELNKLHAVIMNQRIKEEILSSELQQKRNEIKLWEAEATTLYGESLITDIYVAVFKEKVNELIGACESLQDGNSSKLVGIEQLKDRLHILEHENEEMKSELAAYSALIVSLGDTIMSLEDHVHPERKNYERDNQETQVSSEESHLHNSCQKLTEDQSCMVIDGISTLLELQTRVKAIENSMMEKVRLIMEERLDTNIKLEAAMEEVRKLQSKRISVREEAMKATGGVVMQLEHEKHGDEHNKLEFSEVGSDISMKDIPLDQVSHCSSHDRGFGLHAVSRSRIAESDEDMLEGWEPAEQDQNLDLTYKAPQENTGCDQIEEVEDQKGEYSLPELQYAKELGLDKLVPSKRFTGLNQEGKILDRLASDVQKLTNLQVTVQDLKMMVEHFEKSKKVKKSKKGKDIEFTTLKAELKEVEEAIMQLVDVNGKLTKTVTQLPLVPDGKDITVLEETGRIRRCSRVSEQARQGSEMIGRLQAELQRIHFVLLRLETGYKMKGTKFADRRVPLRDYLYSHERSHPTLGRKKGMLFACVKPPMKLD